MILLYSYSEQAHPLGYTRFAQPSASNSYWIISRSSLDSLSESKSTSGTATVEEVY